MRQEDRGVDLAVYKFAGRHFIAVCGFASLKYLVILFGTWNKTSADDAGEHAALLYEEINGEDVMQTINECHYTHLPRNVRQISVPRTSDAHVPPSATVGILRHDTKVSIMLNISRLLLSLNVTQCFFCSLVQNQNVVQEVVILG